MNAKPVAMNPETGTVTFRVGKAVVVVEDCVSIKEGEKRAMDKFYRGEIERGEQEASRNFNPRWGR